MEGLKVGGFMTWQTERKHKLNILAHNVCGLSPLISEATHICQNSSPCIDLIFKKQLILVTDTGVQPSLHENRHYQITYVKFNCQITYPPPYHSHV